MQEWLDIIALSPTRNGLKNSHLSIRKRGGKNIPLDVKKGNFHYFIKKKFEDTKRGNRNRNSKDSPYS